MAKKKRRKKNISDVDRLLSQLESLKKNLPRCGSDEARSRTMLKIYEVERKLKVARGNVKSGLTGRAVSVVRGGSPGLGKR